MSRIDPNKEERDAVPVFVRNACECRIFGAPSRQAWFNFSMPENPWPYCGHHDWNFFRLIMAFACGEKMNRAAPAPPAARAIVRAAAEIGRSIGKEPA